MKRCLWMALGITVSLWLAMTVLARLPSSQINSRGIYIQFDDATDNIDRTHGFPVSGGHKRWEWKDLEPSYGTRNFDEIRSFVNQQSTRGKKAAIGFETFVGRINTSGENGSLAVPAWLWAQDGDVRQWNTVDNARYVLNYLNATYQARYGEFIDAFADWLAANPDVAANVAWVEMGVGLYSETQPSDQYVAANANDYTYYANFATGGETPGPNGWSNVDWFNYVKWCIDRYYNAFRVRNNLSSITLFLNCAPEFKGTRGDFTDYAALKEVGLKNNGLQVDRHPYYLYQPLEKWGSVVATKTVPIAWETYEQWLRNETELYWGLLCALDKHPDILEPDRWLMVDHAYQKRDNYVAIWNWVEPYLGVTPSTTPGVWCALRETEYSSNGEPGNFSFWLFQKDNQTAGQTVAEWNVTSFKEGRYTRRTDQATGNRYMWFQIYDGYENGNSGHASFTVYVTYLDKGTDAWKLKYDSFTGEKDTALVYKTNTNTWKKATFVLTDARFGNGIGSQCDLRIDCNNDGDEYIHLVEIKRSGGSSPTPTPTSTPIVTVIQGSVTLQRPNKPAPDPSWAVPLTVTVGSTSYAVSTDQSGNFSLSGLTPGTYSIGVKNGHTRRNVKSNVTLVAGTNTIYFGTLLEGDANSDNCINITDFSILKGGFTPVNDPHADFNQDAIVNITDFSLLKSNFGACGDISVPSPPLSGMAQQVKAGTAARVVQVSVDPAYSSVSRDQVFDVKVQIAADGQPVDGAEVHLDFDPLYLQVVDASGNPTNIIQNGNVLDVPIQNRVDNAHGAIDFAAGTFGTSPSGTFVLATIRLKALRGTVGSTSLTFVTRDGSPTAVTYAGDSVLAGTSSGIVTIGQSYRICLPLITQQ